MKSFLFLLLVISSLSSVSQTDTLNQTDEKGLKQGHWIIIGDMKPEKGFCDSCKIEEGTFLDDQRSGEWIKYNNDGSVRCKGVYENRKVGIGCGVVEGKWTSF